MPYFNLWEEQGVTFCRRATSSIIQMWTHGLGVEMRDKYEILPGLWIGFDNWNAQYFHNQEINDP